VVFAVKDDRGDKLKDRKAVGIRREQVLMRVNGRKEPAQKLHRLSRQE
jgi:hypothetical protein